MKFDIQECLVYNHSSLRSECYTQDSLRGLELFELDGLMNQTDLKLVEHSVHGDVRINSVDLNKTIDRIYDSIQD